MRSKDRDGIGARLRSTIIRPNGYFESISGRTQILHVGFTVNVARLPLIPNGGIECDTYSPLIIPIKSIPPRFSYRFVSRFRSIDRRMEARIREGEDSKAVSHATRYLVRGRQVHIVFARRFDAGTSEISAFFSLFLSDSGYSQLFFREKLPFLAPPFYSSPS